MYCKEQSMKSKYFKCLGVILTGLVVLFTMTACPSTPIQPEQPPAEVPVQPPPVGVPVPPPVQDDGGALAALDAAAARAQAARQLVMDFQGQYLLPSDWAEASSLFDQAEQQRSTGTAQEARESTARYEAAADAFEALAQGTIALYFENLARQLADGRGVALNAGAAELAPDFLLHADNAADAANARYQANDFRAARDTALDALAMYDAIAAGIQALAIREEIIDNGIEYLVPEFLWEADDVATDAMDRWDAGDYPGAQTGAVTALSMYAVLRTMLDAQLAWEGGIEEAVRELTPEAVPQLDVTAMEAITNWEAGDFYGALVSAELLLVRTLRAGAAAERQRALNVRGNVAVRPEFDSAQAIYTRAASAYQVQSLAEAANLFTECRPLFTVVARLAVERQILAEEALRLANERMAESDETARAAELILEGDVQ